MNVKDETTPRVAVSSDSIGKSERKALIIFKDECLHIVRRLNLACISL